MLRKLALLLALYVVTSPAFAASKSFGERTQETVPVGNNRFLIFVGAPDGNRTGYTVDLIQVEEGIPFYVPLFIEDFDPDTGSVNLSYGVAFFANSYAFDRDTKILIIKATDVADPTQYELRYSLDGDILHLQQATATTPKSSVPKLLYKAPVKTDAPAEGAK